MSEGIQFWKEATDFWFEQFTAALSDVKGWKEEALYWRKKYLRETCSFPKIWKKLKTDFFDVECYIKNEDL